MSVILKPPTITKPNKCFHMCPITAFIDNFYPSAQKWIKNGKNHDVDKNARFSIAFLCFILVPSTKKCKKKMLGQNCFENVVLCYTPLKMYYM